MKEQFNGINIKQKTTMKIQQMNLDISPNKILLELIDYLFKFIQIKKLILKGLKLENIIYQNT